MSLQRRGLEDPSELERARAELREATRRDQIKTAWVAGICGVFLFVTYVVVIRMTG